MSTAKTTPVLLTLRDIREQYLPVCRRTVFRMIATGNFPKADVRMTERLQFWKRETVERWFREQGESSKYNHT